jgi:NADH-quinone oxidoreductase subunit N
MTGTPANFDFLPALPEITLLVAACVVLLVDLVLPETRRNWSYWLTQLGVIATAWLSLYVFHESPAHTFGNTFIADALADRLKFLSCVTVALTLAYSRGYLTARGLFRGETFALMMFALLGMMVMISANHFLLLYLGLELMSLSLYAMIALQRESGRELGGRCASALGIRYRYRLAR